MQKPVQTHRHSKKESNISIITQSHARKRIHPLGNSGIVRKRDKYPYNQTESNMENMQSSTHPHRHSERETKTHTITQSQTRKTYKHPPL